MCWHSVVEDWLKAECLSLLLLSLFVLCISNHFLPGVKPEQADCLLCSHLMWGVGPPPDTRWMGALCPCMVPAEHPAPLLVGQGTLGAVLVDSHCFGYVPTGSLYKVRNTPADIIGLTNGRVKEL